MARIMPHLLFWKIGFLFVLLHYCEGQVCPEHVHVTINVNKQSQDEDQVYLTSILSGVNKDELEYYWWLIHETNSPLYIYSNVYGIDEISKGYEGLVFNTSHSATSKHNFSSTIAIRSKEMHYEVYRCEFVLGDYSICAQTIRVDNNVINNTNAVEGHLHPTPPSQLSESQLNISLAFKSPANYSQILEYARPILFFTHLSLSPAHRSWLIILLTVFTIASFFVTLIILFIMIVIYRKIQESSSKAQPSPESGSLMSSPDNTVH